MPSPAQRRNVLAIRSMHKASQIGRLQIVAVLYAGFLLITGVLDAFVDMKLINDLTFHSPLFHVFLLVIFWLVAVIISRRRNHEND